MTSDPVTFIHNALVIRTCGPSGESGHGYRYPTTVGSMVECPDWEPQPKCGHGFHGLLDGIGDHALIDASPSRLWQVFGVKRDEVVAIDDAKVKFRRGLLLYIGDIGGAMTMVQPETVKAIMAKAIGNTATGDSGHAAATGYNGNAAATGDRGHAAATGDSGNAAATGDRGHAAATGYNGNAAATGDRGHAAATGDSGHAAATGDSAVAASVGIHGTAKAGIGGWVVLAAYDDAYKLKLVKAAKVGSEGIEAGKTYRLGLDGAFVEVA